MLDKIIEIVPFVLAVAVSAGGFLFTQYHKRIEQKEKENCKKPNKNN